MSDDLFITAIIPASVLATFQKVGDALGVGFIDMFSTGLSPDGSAPATHYIASGKTFPRFVEAMKNATLGDLFDYAKERAVDTAVNFAYTKLQVKSSIDNCDVSQDDPAYAMKRLGLRMIADKESSVAVKG